ncbi:secretin N-terminal domain-containing protein [Atopomonas sediminilitoris]|uniref:secretin N-terminal domain-containing protein n=1 Tax=Atopomonas sediminilitoris TaxID=2919919 RepID=UPI001F4DB464|nr:secretin [Atopomonas sediminilitoris]
MSRFTALLLLILSTTALAAPRTEVLELRYNTADDLLPTVQAILGSEGRVSAYGNQLIINAEQHKILEVQDLLRQLDKSPQRLLITVDTSSDSQLNERGYRVDGELSAGGVSVISGDGEIDGKDQVRIIRRTTDSRGGGQQQVQATEGYPAFIQIGQSVPITTSTATPYGGWSNTQYRDVTRGYYVTVTLSGNIAHISLSSRNDRLSQSQPGVIDTQSTDTRLTTRLGEWVTFGGISESQSGNDSDFLRHKTTQGREDVTLRLKVDVMN